VRYRTLFFPVSTALVPVFEGKSGLFHLLIHIETRKTFENSKPAQKEKKGQGFGILGF